VGGRLPRSAGVRQDGVAEAWVAAGAERSRIVPMAGEIALAQAAKISAYALAAARHGVAALHFYAYGVDVPQAVWDAIAALGRK
jgi:hypothetical protein